LAAVTTAKPRPGAFTAVRNTVLIAVSAALVAGLTACGSGPSQANSAVIVDGQSVSVDEVQNLLDKDPPDVGNTIGTTTFNSGNTYPSVYDPLGRRYTVGVNLRF
jgi:hypothetical protein